MAKGTQVVSWEAYSAFAPSPHSAGSTYGRATSSGRGVVVVDGSPLVVGESVEEVTAADSVGGGDDDVDDDDNDDNAVLDVASWVSEQPAVTASSAATPTTTARALM